MKYVIITIMLFAAASLSAQDYDELLRQVIVNNPEIASFEADADSRLAEMRSQNNLPETEVDFEHQWGQKNIGNKWSIGISQGFEWPGVYNARRSAAKSASEAMRFLKRSNYLDKLLEIKLLFIDIVNTRKNLAVMEQVCNHMSQLKTKYHEGFSHGEVTIIDVNKIDIEYINSSRRCNELKTQMVMLQNSLTAINGGKDCSEIIDALTEYPQDMLLSENDYIEHIKQFDPQLGYSMQMSKSQASSVKAAKLGNLPGFSLGYMHVNELGEHFNGLKVGLSLPLFSNRNKVKAADALLRSMDYDAVGIELSKLSAMYTDRTKVLSLFEEISQYRTIFENSDNLNLLKKALDGGEISLLTYLQEVNYFLEAQQEYINLVYQYHSLLARLNRYLLLK